MSKAEGHVADRKKFSYFDVLKSLFPYSGDSVGEVIRKLIFLFAIIVFGVCSCLIFNYFFENYQNKKNYDNLKNIYLDNSGTDTLQSTEETEDVEYLSFLSGAENLLSINPDTVGYISIPDTQISYPVVQLKGDEEEGNEYYLEHDFYKENSKAGAIFLDWRNSFDYAVDGKKAEAISDNLIIYGHEMANEAMFGTLKYYKDNYEYYGKHPVIHLNSNYKEYQYKIFGVCITNAEESSGEVFQYFNQINFNTSEEFYNYVNGVKKRSLILNDVDVKYGDKLLTLSTCNGMFDDARLIIVARLVREGEDPYAGTQNNSRNPNPLMPDIYYRYNGGSYDSNAEFVPYG